MIKLEEQIKEIFEYHETGIYWAIEETGSAFPPTMVLDKLVSLIETERKEAVTEYRINFEKGVQDVVENTVAKDRVEEIRKEAVREFAKWLNEVPITVVGDLELGYYISKHLTQTEGKK